MHMAYYILSLIYSYMEHSICKSILINTFIKLKSKLFFFNLMNVFKLFLDSMGHFLTFKYFEVVFFFPFCFLFFKWSPNPHLAGLFSPHETAHPNPCTTEFNTELKE